MINRTEMMNAMEQLRKAGIVEETLVRTFRCKLTGHKIGIANDHFYLYTGESLVYYFYDNLSSVVLFAQWGTAYITLQVTPKKSTTGGRTYYEDSFHFATYKPTSVPFEGYVMCEPEGE